jgi:hypothetical protein
MDRGRPGLTRPASSFVGRVGCNTSVTIGSWGGALACDPAPWRPIDSSNAPSRRCEPCAIGGCRKGDDRRNREPLPAPPPRNNTSVNELSQRSNQDGGAFRPRNPRAQESQAIMEIAAAVLFVSVVLWFIEVASSNGA